MRAITRQIGGSALARAAIEGGLPQWYARSLRGPAEWRAAAAQVAQEFSGRDWHSELLPALKPSLLASERLRAAAQSDGVVVTGGQQPGLFGGPLYVLHKAVTLLEMANALEEATGRAVAPIFWAATDDADFVEASHVSVVRHDRLDTLSMSDQGPVGRSMAATPLGDLTDQIARLEDACGSAPDAYALEAVRAAYTSGATVGGAYVQLLRAVLEPMGVAVLDASHPSVRAAGRNVLRAALVHADRIAVASRQRSSAITDAGFHAQAADVPNLSLVFETLPDGTRRRIPVRVGAEASTSIHEESLGPNVLLRPVMERQILPTVSYIGGPGEVAYFAQVSAVADALGVATPMITPRWSGTLLEPAIEELLAKLGAAPDDFVDPHAMESRVARDAVSPAVRSAIDDLRIALDASAARMRDDAQTSEALARSVGTMRAAVEHRLARLERRYAAAIKQRGSDALRDVAHVRANLYPNGAPQERVLSFVPFLARYGAAAIDAIRSQARIHVATVIHGG